MLSPHFSGPIACTLEQDDMLPRAAWLVQVMRRELNAIATAAPPELYVLADSSVSAWDPDVIAAQHVGADGLAQRVLYY